MDIASHDKSYFLAEAALGIMLGKFITIYFSFYLNKNDSVFRASWNHLIIVLCDLRNEYPTIHLIHNYNDKTNRTERKTLDSNFSTTVGKAVLLEIT